MKLKILMSLLLFFTLSAARACQDFSGKYQLTVAATQVILTVSQDACNSIRFSYFYPASNGNAVQSYIADHVKRKTGEDAKQIVYQTSEFNGATFINHVEFLQKTTLASVNAVSTYHLDLDGNFYGLDQYYNASGALYSMSTRLFRKLAPVQ